MKGGLQQTYNHKAHTKEKQETFQISNVYKRNKFTQGGGESYNQYDT
jgi:hypothetical protein